MRQPFYKNSMNFEPYNQKILALFSLYINECPDAIDGAMIHETMQYCGVNAEEAYRILLGGILEMREDKVLRGQYLPHLIKHLDYEKYKNNPYMQTVKATGVRSGDWEFAERAYRPYEAFVYDESELTADGRLLPKIGFFDREYRFPCILEGEREWMLITPNEIETMKAPIAAAHGEVVTYGLGLGYFPFMVSAKENVSSVTVVEKDARVIKLFERHILPQFPHRDKIQVVCEDAFSFAARKQKFDFVFADIWHDPSDGVDAYLRFKSLERDDAEYAYWIEKTLQYYI